MMRLKFFAAAVLLACTALTAVRAEETTETGRATGVKALVIGDTKAFPGGDAASDVGAVTRYLDGLPGFQEDRDLRVLTGDDVNAETILKAVDDLDVAPKETLFVYYDGHGAYDPDLAPNDDEGGHHLQIVGGDLLRSELMRHLKAKNARLTVLVTETCNVASEFAPTRHQLMAAALPTPVVSASLERLLFDFTGVVDVNASAPGQSSWSNSSGSFFTQSLLRTLDDDDKFRDPASDLPWLTNTNRKVWEMTEDWAAFLGRASEKAAAVYQKQRKAAQEEEEPTDENAKAAREEMIAQEDQRPQIFRLDVRQGGRPALAADEDYVPPSPFDLDSLLKGTQPAILDPVK